MDWLDYVTLFAGSFIVAVGLGAAVILLQMRARTLSLRRDVESLKRQYACDEQSEHDL